MTLLPPDPTPKPKTWKEYSTAEYMIRDCEKCGTTFTHFIRPMIYVVEHYSGNAPRLDKYVGI